RPVEEPPSPNYSNPSPQGSRPGASSPPVTEHRSGPAGEAEPPPYPHLGKAPQRAVQRVSLTDGERPSGGGHTGAGRPGDTNPGAASSTTAAPRSASSLRRFPPPP